MVIDCHGHYTTAPKQLQAFRDEQIAALKDPHAAPPKVLATMAGTGAARGGGRPGNAGPALSHAITYDAGGQ